MLGLGSGISPTLVDMHDQKSLNFDGDDQYVDVDVITNNIDPDEFTISVWFKFGGAVTSGRHIFRAQVNDGTTNNLIQLFYHASANDMRFVQTRGGTANLADSAGSIVAMETDRAWHHAVGTIDNSASEIKFYLDGTLKETTTLEGTHSGTYAIADIGQNTQGGNYWYGNLNDIAIYDAVIDASQVTAIYNGGKPNDVISAAGMTRTPIIYYRFETNLSTAMNSGTAGTGENGTLVNTPVRQHDTP